MKTFRQIACLLTLAVCVGAQDERQVNLDSFEFVWRAVQDKHWDPKLGGLDWQAVHDELRPAMEKAQTRDQARAVLQDMLSRLHQTHFAILPNDVYSSLDDAGPGGDGTTGIDVRVLDGRAVVTSVTAASGIHTGWELLKIHGKPIAPLIARINRTYRESSLRQLQLRHAILSRLGGEPGETIALEFLDGQGRAVSKAVRLTPPRGNLAHFGYLPPSYVWFDSHKLPGGAGYIAFNAFLDPAHVMEKFGEAVKACLHCPGLVIDLRGNPGGIGIMAMGMAGWFFDRPNLHLGTLILRDSKLNFAVTPRAETYHGPLAVLVDECSASTAEIFAQGLKDLHRARILGSRTAAAALPSVIERLPNGDGFQFAIANYISEGGKPLEGLGVSLDVEAPPTRAALLRGEDPALDAAVRWLARKRAGTLPDMN